MQRAKPTDDWREGAKRTIRKTQDLDDTLVDGEDVATEACVMQRRAPDEGRQEAEHIASTHGTSDDCCDYAC